MPHREPPHRRLLTAERSGKGARLPFLPQSAAQCRPSMPDLTIARGVSLLCAPVVGTRGHGIRPRRGPQRLVCSPRGAREREHVSRFSPSPPFSAGPCSPVQRWPGGAFRAPPVSPSSVRSPLTSGARHLGGHP
ncbi:hypothetical protein NDU88_005067 [Pleurodeles waltl]|uniref:Uncharacterized protein n=1 Tax=Pleurodeles waltl TaxID=8319 RepID=A0AAV7V2W3_PLEWA|nr:hypothetical protein NDU88_005067 [Pleurodeles waltl]